jgi:flagellar M-ring protein FliF
MALVKPENVLAQARGFNALSLLRQLGLMVGLAASVAIGVYVVMWSRTPDYSLLYGQLSDAEAGEVATALDSLLIPYRIDPRSGAITVPAGKLQEARLRLATRGLPHSDGSGFEMLSETPAFGVSQFMEQARYNHAIEGELARSIASLQRVKSARVHLAIPKRSAFVRDRDKPRASVVLKLYSGARLDDERLAGIVHLVASSVEGLEPDQVTVVDQNGRLLTAGNNTHGIAATASQLAYRHKLEDDYIKRIEDILIPVVGEKGVRAQVAADIDFNAKESTSESYQPDQHAVRSEETFEESTRGSGASGVPGALTNQPPPAGTLQNNAQGDAQGAAHGSATGSGTTATPLNSTRRATRNYELDRNISHTTSAPGDIKSLSVAVLVDYRTTTDAQGKTERVPLTDDEMKRITGLVKEAVGFSVQRKDSINVANIPFLEQDEVVEPLPDIPVWKQPWVAGLVKQVLGGIAVLFVVFGVLKPVMRSLATVAPAKNPAALPHAGAAGNALPGGSGSVAGMHTALPLSPEQQFGMARNMIENDPRRVAHVVKDWVSTDG